MALLAYNPYLNRDMPIKKNISEEDIYSRLKVFEDQPDNPPSYVERNISNENAINQELFDVMKYEVNRLNSYTGKWPLSYIKPQDLSQNGFFYLQSEDKVQCAFCNIIIDDWNVGDKPIKKHMMKQPKCKFLMTADAGNIPYIKPKPVTKNVSKCISSTKTRITQLHKPKYPRMSDIKHRLLTYRDWPLLMLSSRQLAECGLFYTGVGDAVTCFYCGGSLGNWELNDDPWVEHEKFYPECGFLDLVKTRQPISNVASVNPAFVKSNSAPASTSVLESSVPNEVIRQACEIFPDSLVQKVATEHYRSTGKHFTSLHDICEAVLQHKEQEKSILNTTNTLSASNNSQKTLSENVTSNKDRLLGKKCKVDSHCKSVEACNLSTGKCYEVCPGACGIGASCKAVNHKPACSCPPGFTGNAYVECKKIESSLPIFKCGEDGVSPNPISCESFIRCSHHRKYVVPCGKDLHFRNETGQCEKPCEAHCDQTLACKCGWSTCGRLMLEECKLDSDCKIEEACDRSTGLCYEVCDSCGINASCRAANHRNVCYCPPGYTGDPLNECRKIPQ